MKKAVFFDIDGTLWNERMQIPESTVTAIRALRENGHYAFLCSGRSKSNIRSKSLLGIGFDGVVAACGTHVDFHGKQAFQYLLSKEQVNHSVHVLNRHRMHMVLEGPRYTYVDENTFLNDPYVVYLRKELGEDLKLIKDCEDIEINKMSAAVNNADLTEVQKELGDDFDIIVHNAKLIEIVPKGHSKATGIRKVCELLNIPQENTYAFGDSANDLEMLRFVKHGVAMGNGTMEVKSAAEYITTDIEKNGIRHGLRHYGLIS